MLNKEDMEKFLLKLVDAYQDAASYRIQDTSGDFDADEQELRGECGRYRGEIKAFFSVPTIAVSREALETYQSCKAQYQKQTPLIKALPLKDDADFIERMCMATDILSGRIMHRRD